MEATLHGQHYNNYGGEDEADAPRYEGECFDHGPVVGSRATGQKLPVSQQRGGSGGKFDLGGQEPRKQEQEEGRGAGGDYYNNNRPIKQEGLYVGVVEGAEQPEQKVPLLNQ